MTKRSLCSPKEIYQVISEVMDGRCLENQPIERF